MQERNIRALNRIVERYLDGNIVIGTHGTALSTIIRYFDSSFGYNEFNQIKNLMPWIVMISFDHNACTEIKKYNLFERYKIK